MGRWNPLGLPSAQYSAGVRFMFIEVNKSKEREREGNTWGQNHQGSLQQGDAFELVFKNKCRGRGGRDEQVVSSVDIGGKRP